jgi:hypothetical protein
MRRVSVNVSAMLGLSSSFCGCRFEDGIFLFFCGVQALRDFVCAL